MKRIVSILVALCIATVSAFAQAALPSMMVVPSDSWCNEHGFMQIIEHDGVKNYVPQYRSALVEEPDLKVIVSLINSKMTNEGFRLVDLESTLKTLETDNTLDAVTGPGMQETLREQLSRVAKCDIMLEVSWKMNTVGPKKSMTFNMRALDAYSQKEVATAIGTSGLTYTVELPVMLSEATDSYIGNFTQQLKSYFKELQTYGRELTFEVRVGNGSMNNLETEVAGDMLTYLIEDWVIENATGGAKTPDMASENVLRFKGVRMPCATPEGRPVDARFWIRPLLKILRENGIEHKVHTKGLGHVMIQLI